ncbi:OLC1v1034292C1 [Oldenlandia corymbosa var. corymbosa]|uniref:OLC1v1034292C1 n=1 Tax=Oldenlandia corymbosa var. corymbosa TaxID=529605 RepID=A0AAV1CQF5_OLDCO|nr:OLC1v1034292C1 [Oldenlandia corymbosa var. corymbosa]
MVLEADYPMPQHLEKLVSDVLEEPITRIWFVTIQNRVERLQACASYVAERTRTGIEVSGSSNSVKIVISGIEVDVKQAKEYIDDVLNEIHYLGNPIGVAKGEIAPMDVSNLKRDVIHLSQGLAAWVIGHKGQGIRKLRDDSGCRMYVLNSEKLIVVGTEEKVQSAVKFLNELLRGVRYAEQIRIPMQMFPVQWLCDVTGCNVDVSCTPPWMVLNLYGLFEQIEYAKLIAFGRWPSS